MPARAPRSRIARATARGSAQWRTDLVVRYRLLHVSGESLDLEAPGCGVDFGDKGAYKAMTGALKYALRHTLLIPTGDDAEIAPPTEPDEAPRAASPKAKPAGKAKETAAETATRQATHHPSWTADQAGFFARIGEIPNATAASVGAVLERLGKPRASQMDSEARAGLLRWLASPAGQAALGAALPEPGSEG